MCACTEDHVWSWLACKKLSVHGIWIINKVSPVQRIDRNPFLWTVLCNIRYQQPAGNVYRVLQHAFIIFFNVSPFHIPFHIFHSVFHSIFHSILHFTFYSFLGWGHERSDLLWFLWMNYSTTEHNATKLITSFHSGSTADSSDINISLLFKNTQNHQKLACMFSPTFANFKMSLKHWTRTAYMPTQAEQNIIVQTILL